MKRTLAVLAVATAVPATAAFAAEPSEHQPPQVVASANARVPNVVGMNHQAAQDRLQAAGFYALRERDCTGRGRALIWDRNWKVRRQNPRGGRRVSTNRTITLCSVKYTD